MRDVQRRIRKGGQQSKRQREKKKREKILLKKMAVVTSDDYARRSILGRGGYNSFPLLKELRSTYMQRVIF